MNNNLEKLKKLTELVGSHVKIENLVRLTEGDLSHIGDALIKGKQINIDGKSVCHRFLLFDSDSKSYSIKEEPKQLDPKQFIGTGLLFSVHDSSAHKCFSEMAIRRVSDYLDGRYITSNGIKWKHAFPVIGLKQVLDDYSKLPDGFIWRHYYHSATRMAVDNGVWRSGDIKETRTSTAYVECLGLDPEYAHLSRELGIRIIDC